MNPGSDTRKSVNLASDVARTVTEPIPGVSVLVQDPAVSTIIVQDGSDTTIVVTKSPIIGAGDAYDDDIDD